MELKTVLQCVLVNSALWRIAENSGFQQIAAQNRAVRTGPSLNRNNDLRLLMEYGDLKAVFPELRYWTSYRQLFQQIINR